MSNSKYTDGNASELVVVNSTAVLECDNVWSPPILLVVLTYMFILVWICIWLVITRKLPWFPRLLTALGLSDVEVHPPLQLPYDGRSISSPVTPTSLGNPRMKTKVGVPKPASLQLETAKFNNNKGTGKRVESVSGKSKRTTTLAITSTSTRSMSKRPSLSKSASKAT